jgi:rhodanese-related sulfurtransferase
VIKYGLGSIWKYIHSIHLVLAKKEELMFMKRHPKGLAVVVLTCMVAGILLFSGCVSNSTTPQTDVVAGWGIKNISPEEAYDLIKTNKKNPDFVIIDVRLSRRLANGYIEDAINITLDGGNPATFQGKVAGLDKNKTYLTYCPDGCGAAAREMNGLGFNKTYNISGGYNSWVQKGLPIVE